MFVLSWSMLRLFGIPSSPPIFLGLNQPKSCSCYLILGGSFNASDFLNIPLYSDRLSIIDMPSLRYRRLMLDVLFVCRFLNGTTLAPDFLSLLSLSVPTKMLRYYTLLQTPPYPTNYLINNSMVRFLQWLQFNNIFIIL